MRHQGVVCTLALLLGFALATSSHARPIALRPSQEQTQSQTQAQARGQGQSQSQAPDKTAAEHPPNPGSSATISEPSLAEFAREQRAERAKDSNAPPRVFTNDNLPKGSGGLSVVGTPPDQENASASAEDETRTSGRLRLQVAGLKERLDTHRRELGVLQQKLGENQVQYYPNPNDILHQEYSREDINRLTLAIERKKQQVEADEQALAEAEDEVARRGLAPTAPQADQKDSLAAPKPDLSSVPKGSEQYWRVRFKAARGELAKAQEQQKLAEDEVALLQSQQAHEMASGNASAFNSQISAKQSEAESKRAAVEQAQRDLEALEQELKESRSPQAWSEPE
ncbi:MAG TPA: hypothetical protein VG206_01680 [Terriglobia bacterium]|nr:hypothetical protein [Terriglobia bacterium]